MVDNGLDKPDFGGWWLGAVPLLGGNMSLEVGGRASILGLGSLRTPNVAKLCSQRQGFHP